MEMAASVHLTALTASGLTYSYSHVANMESFKRGGISWGERLYFSFDLFFVNVRGRRGEGSDAPNSGRERGKAMPL